MRDYAERCTAKKRQIYLVRDYGENWQLGVCAREATPTHPAPAFCVGYAKGVLYFNEWREVEGNLHLLGCPELNT